MTKSFQGNILADTYYRTCMVKAKVMDSEFLLKECQIAESFSEVV